jgi:hypothetical protein
VAFGFLLLRLRGSARQEQQLGQPATLLLPALRQQVVTSLQRTVLWLQQGALTGRRSAAIGRQHAITWLSQLIASIEVLGSGMQLAVDSGLHAHNNLTFPDGTLASAFADSLPETDEVSPGSVGERMPDTTALRSQRSAALKTQPARNRQVPGDKLPPIKPHNDEAERARANELDLEFKRDLDFVTEFIRQRLPAYGDFYSNALTVALYGGYDSVQEVREYTNADVFLPQLPKLAWHLQKLVKDEIRLTAHSQTGSKTQGVSSRIALAQETLKRIRGIQNRKWMTLAEWHWINRRYEESFDRRDEVFKKPLQEEPNFPFRIVIQEATDPSYDLFNILYPVGGGYIGWRPGDLRDHVAHDRDHILMGPKMPDNARQFVRQAVKQIRFYNGFEALWHGKSRTEVELFKIVWFDISRERDLEITPRVLARITIDTDRLIDRILLRFLHGSYRISRGKTPSVDEVRLVIRAIHNYVRNYDDISVDNPVPDPASIGPTRG